MSNFERNVAPSNFIFSPPFRDHVCVAAYFAGNAHFPLNRPQAFPWSLQPGVSSPSTQTEPAVPKSSVDRKAANVLFPAAGGPNNQRTYVKTPGKKRTNDGKLENPKPFGEDVSPILRMVMFHCRVSFQRG